MYNLNKSVFCRVNSFIWQAQRLNLCLTVMLYMQVDIIAGQVIIRYKVNSDHIYNQH